MTGRSSLSATVIYSKRLSGLKTGKGRMAVICERMAQQACYYNRTWPFVATAAELQNMRIGNSADRPAIVECTEKTNKINMTWACPNNNAEFMRQMWQGAVHWQQKTSPNTEQISCTDLSERTRQDKDFRSLFSWKLKTFIIGWGQHQGPPSGWGLSLWSLHVPPMSMYSL